MGLWDSITSGAKKIGQAAVVAPFTGVAGALGGAFSMSDRDKKDLLTFGGGTRDARAQEREQQAAQAAQTARENLQSGYDTYRSNLSGAQDVYGSQMGQVDTSSKEAMDKYRIDRGRLDTQADTTRQTLMGMEKNMLNEGVKNVNDITDQYVNTANKLSTQAEQQAADAKQTYTGTVKPNLMNNLNDARNFQNTIAGQAMSLADAMDVNNKVAAGQRGLYNDLASQMTGRYDEMSQQERADLEQLMARGEGQFAGQVENTQKRGLADVGVLSALGAQATNLLGGNQPMTGGQMAALMGQQGQQASEAYAMAQQRMQALEDQKRSYSLQGLQTMGDRASDLRRGSLAQEGALRGEGIAAGTQQSSLMYDRGYQGTTEAMDRTASRLADLMGGETSYNALAQGLRGEQSGYGQNIYGAKSAAEQNRQAVADRLWGSQAGFEEGKISRGYGNTAEDLALRNQALGIDAAAAQRQFGLGQNLNSLDYQNLREQTGLEQSAVTNQIQMQAARDQQNLQQTMGMLGVAGQLGGAYLGGPAMAGAGAANAAGQFAGGYQSARQPAYNPYQFSQQMYDPYGQQSRYGNTMNA